MSRHVLVCRPDSDGDVLLAGPAVRAVAAGADRVTLLCGPRGRAAAELLPGVDEVLCATLPWIDPNPEPVTRGAVLGLAARIVARSPDEALVLGSFHQSPLPTALLLRLACVPRVAAISVDYPGSLLDVRVPDPGDVHEVERGLHAARAAGFELPPGDEGRLAVRRTASSPVPAGFAPYVVVHPGASVPTRAWGAGRNAELVAALGERGVRVVLTGGPGEEALTARVAGEPREGVLDLGGRTTLAELAEVLAGAAAVVVGNTGPAHLAAAVGTPVVSLFAPVVPALRWRPWGVRHAILGDQAAPCRDTRSRICPVPGHPCLHGVAAGAVVAELERLAGPVLREAVAA